jgi:hypothetical protein
MRNCNLATDYWPQGIDLVYEDTEAQEVAKQLDVSGRKCVRAYAEFKE